MSSQNHLFLSWKRRDEMPMEDMKRRVDVRKVSGNVRIANAWMCP